MTKRSKTQVPGYVLWEGFSPFDGQPIVAIATWDSANRKTGNMIQVFILRRDMSPLDAVALGQDASICGSCPHRGDGTGKGRSCYVVLIQAPLSVFNAYRRGSYGSLADFEARLSRVRVARRIRWGAYGDPAMLPAELVARVNGHAKVAGHTGYTHQHQHSWASWAKGQFQASCDNAAQHTVAQRDGWRTFTVLPAAAQAPDFARQCPATVAGSTASCLTCRLCDGAKTDVWVAAHGSGAAHITG